MQAPYRVKTTSVDWKKAQEKAALTARWAVTMAKVRIRRVASRTRWQLVTFYRKSGGESVGVVDMLAIRKDHGAPIIGARRGDALQITRWFHRGRSKDGETGRFARLRIPKSSISKRSSPFPPIADLREKNAIFQLSEPRRRPI